MNIPSALQAGWHDVRNWNGRVKRYMDSSAGGSVPKEPVARKSNRTQRSVIS